MDGQEGPGPNPGTPITTGNGVRQSREAWVFRRVRRRRREHSYPRKRVQSGKGLSTYLVLAGALALALACSGRARSAHHAQRQDAQIERRGSVLWRGDFETGDLSQWWRVQAVPGDIHIVTSHVRQGSYAAKFVVHPGDEPLARKKGERSELRASQDESGGYSGHTEWYAWSTRFPRNLHPTRGTSWNAFVQWHDSRNNGCGPNIVYQVDEAKSPARIRVRVRGGPVSLSTCEARYDRSWYPATVRLRHWYDFVLAVRWSAHRRGGFVKGWIDRKLVVPKTRMATLYPKDGVYVKQGFYRKPSRRVSTLYQDGMRRGDSYSSVSGR